MIVIESDFDEDGIISLAMFYRGHRPPLTWKARLWYCWRLLKTGKLFVDQIVLRQAEQEELIRLLQASEKARHE
jgi:hypothetical protein